MAADLILALWLTFGGFGMHQTTATITAYTLAEGSGLGVTRSGTVPIEGQTCAVDPRLIPLGSRVWIDGFGWRVALDTGGAVKGAHVDVYMESVKSALAWGKRTRLIRWVEQK